MNHLYKEGSKKSPTIVLLHGTGGTEHDLIPLAKAIDSDASILALRGDVIEDGMARFFKRLRPGVFDEDDLKIRTRAMIDRIERLSKELGFDKDNVYALGYSNGANIAASVLFHTAETFKGAMLLHPMVPFKNAKLPKLLDKEIFISAGVNDPICSAQESEMLEGMFKSSQADVTLAWFNEGHSIGSKEVDAVKRWYQEIRKKG